MSKVEELLDATRKREPRVRMQIKFDSATHVALMKFTADCRVDVHAFVSAAVDDALTKAVLGG